MSEKRKNWSKGVNLTIRTTKGIRTNLKIAAELKGMSLQDYIAERLQINQFAYEEQFKDAGI
jgi:predicted HicB family RNase H-like nuclease